MEESNECVDCEVILPSSESEKNGVSVEYECKNQENKEPSDTEEVQNGQLQELQEKIVNFEQEILNLQTILQHKDKAIALFEREKKVLEKEKHALKAQVEQSNTEKENIVMRYATKEKFLIDLKKERDNFEKQFNDSKKEIKTITTKYQTLNDEKTRLLTVIDEKCAESKRFQKENEKFKNDITNLETKLKWVSLKLTQETESKNAIEKAANESNQVKEPTPEEKAIAEKQRMEQEANLILLKHENEKKEQQIVILRREYQAVVENLKSIEKQLAIEKEEKTQLIGELETEKCEHNKTQNSLSQELLNAAKIRAELDNLKITLATNAIEREKIFELEKTVDELQLKIEGNNLEIQQLRDKETELLSINKEISEKIVELQNEICLLKSKITGIAAENELIKDEKRTFDDKIEELEQKLKEEIKSKNDERVLLTKHLSEKTKLYENTKKKLDNALGDLEAAKKKQTQITKEFQREISKYKKQVHDDFSEKQSDDSSEVHSESSGAQNPSDNEIETKSSNSASNGCLQIKDLSKKHLVERILRLQQAAIRKSEKIDFLENHTISLVSELQKKSKLLQYYMLRDQSGALTSSKSDQNKTEVSKYGGVMAAIYGGMKNSNQTMTLELSLEINRKLQAVLEDTLLKNITLKENLDILGLEVDKLARQLSQK